jgi:ribosomal protein L40E
MPFLDQPRCPQCRSSLPLNSLFPWALRGGVFRLAPNLGVECPHCGAKLRIIQTRVYVTLGVLLAVVLFGRNGLTSLMHEAHLDALETLELVCVLGAVIGVAILPLFAPNLWQVRLIASDEVVTFPLGTPKAEEDAMPGWICHKCQEKNPENFQLCWKCGHVRPKAPASNNRSRGP